MNEFVCKRYVVFATIGSHVICADTHQQHASYSSHQKNEIVLEFTAKDKPVFNFFDYTGYEGRVLYEFDTLNEMEEYFKEHFPEDFV